MGRKYPQTNCSNFKLSTHADIGATLDFIIPPNIDKKEATRLQALTIKNALYTKKQLTGNLFLYASLQCWDVPSAAYSAKLYEQAGFQGIAIGGMVPRAQDSGYILSIVKTVHREAPNCAIHVFGCGNHKLIPELLKAGANSIDSSSYVRSAVSTKTTEKRGIHTELYKALENLSKINDIIPPTHTSKQTITSNLDIITYSTQRE